MMKKIKIMKRTRIINPILSIVLGLVLAITLFLIFKTVLAWTNPTQAPPGGSGTGFPVNLTTASSELTSDVSMPSGGTYYDGPSVNLATGKWLVTAAIVVSTGAIGGEHGGYTQVKLWDGSTIIASDRRGHNQSPAEPDYLDYYSFSVIVTPSSATTYRLSARTQLANGRIEADLSGGDGKAISYIRAVKIGQ